MVGKIDGEQIVEVSVISLVRTQVWGYMGAKQKGVGKEPAGGAGTAVKAHFL